MVRRRKDPYHSPKTLKRVLEQPAGLPKVAHGAWPEPRPFLNGNVNLNGDYPCQNL
jgi:hypothetical protein